MIITGDNINFFSGTSVYGNFDREIISVVGSGGGIVEKFPMSSGGTKESPEEAKDPPEKFVASPKKIFQKFVFL